MILGKIVGKITTHGFSFQSSAETKKFEFVQVPHKRYEFVLCQIVEITRDKDQELCRCRIIGYKDKDGLVKPIRIPFDQGAEVLRAEDKFIEEIIKLPSKEDGAYMGLLDGTRIKIHLDLQRLLSKHVAVLAKTGAGKSYTVGVLLEEILEKKVPLVIIDPHGEYGTLNQKNENDEETFRMKMFGIRSKAFQTQEYGNTEINPSLKPLRLPTTFTNQELIHLMPKLSSNQMGVLYAALKQVDRLNFANLILALDQEENTCKWNIIHFLEYLHALGIFSETPTPYNDLLQSGKATIINMKGINPDLQEIVVYKLCKDLFQLRKENKVPPFFLVVEEAHNFAPERSYGETKASKILRDIASEGRKFGLGLCVISQRPARIDKSVLSQCTTNIVLKVTNPNDLKALTNSLEGITSESEKEIQCLPIGSALVTGIVDLPLFVLIRPRKTHHGGTTVDILQKESKGMLAEIEDFNAQEILPLIKPLTSKKDIELMQTGKKKIMTTLLPCRLMTCKGDGHFQILVDMITGEIITDVNEYQSKRIPDLSKMTQKQIRILQILHAHRKKNKEQIIRELGDFNVDTHLNQLGGKGYIQINGESYAISQRYLFTKLEKAAIFQKIVYEKIEYDTKLDSKMNLDRIKDAVSRFTDVLDTQECYLVRYKAENGF